MSGTKTGPSEAKQPEEANLLGELLRSPGYLKTLVFCALIGIPVSLVAFWFLVGLHELEKLMWAGLPESLGWNVPPWWWPLPLLLVAGVTVGLVVTRMPGGGGHIPAGGLHTGGASPRALPGVVLAAVLSLPLGATLGPEAPLIALGGGLALLFRDLARIPANPQSAALLGAAGAASAIAVIFGSPLVAAVLLIEVAGVGGPQLFAVMLPALLSSGVGALVFTGFGRWTGLDAPSLSMKVGVPAARLDAGDVIWAVLMAVAIGAAIHLIMRGGQLTARFVAKRTVLHTTSCALAAGVCGAVYALATGRTPADVASSGQATLGRLAADPHSWSVGDLIAVLLCAGAAYALCLGSLRGGPVFPSLFLGGAAGVLLSPLPGLGVVPAMAAGMAAATVSALRLPVSSIVLVVLVLDSAAMTPVIVLAAVVSFVTSQLLMRRSAQRTPGAPAQPQAGPPPPPGPGAAGAAGPA